MRHSGKVINQPLLQEESNDVVHAIVLSLGCGTAVEAGGGGAGLHDSTDDTHHCLKPGKEVLYLYHVNNSPLLNHAFIKLSQITLLHLL